MYKREYDYIVQVQAYSHNLTTNEKTLYTLVEVEGRLVVRSWSQKCRNELLTLILKQEHIYLNQAGIVTYDIRRA